MEMRMFEERLIDYIYIQLIEMQKHQQYKEGNLSFIFTSQINHIQCITSPFINPIHSTPQSFFTMKPTSNLNQNSRKTRDLPNLSQCQSCNFRIDICSGNTALHTLYSEWRIVLLCKDCFFLVQSSQICSYCFKRSSSHNPCYNCCNCNRIVHKNCVLEYGFAAPWSYCCSSSDLFTCVDCWTPKSLAYKSRVPRNGKKRKFLESRSFKESYEMNTAESAVIARELAVRKALSARGAVELAPDAMELIATQGICDVAGGGSGCEGDDDQFTHQLHRATNSSQRIVKKLHGVNSSSFAKRRLPERNEEAIANNCRGSAERQLVCGISRKFVRGVREHVEYLRSNRTDTIKMTETARDANLGLQQKEGEESCSTNKLTNSMADTNITNSTSQSHGQENEIMIPEGETCYGQRDGYSMKYSRRKLNKSSMSDRRPFAFFECLRHESQPLAICSKVSICSSGLTPQQSREGKAVMLPEDEKCYRQSDRYLMKYRRRYLPIRYLMKYSRRKLKGNGAFREETASVENSDLQPERGCYGKWINSSVDDGNATTASQSFRGENLIVIPEDESRCSHADGPLMKYSRRKLKKRNGGGLLGMRGSANLENSELQPDGEQGCYEKWINSKSMNTVSHSCGKENEITVLEDEGFCGHRDGHLMRYRRRKLRGRYLIKYNRRKLNKWNITTGNVDEAKERAVVGG